MLRLSAVFLASALPACLLSADFPALYNSEKEEGSPAPAAEVAAAMKLPEGFQVTVFASEPAVQNPIGMSWDARGRLWVAENYTYAERTKRFELELKDRVIILEDKDWDGQAETRTVFTDNVQMLTSVEVGAGGVWLMCPPQVLFIPDRNQDDIPDGPPEVVLDGFTVAKDNYHNFANGLRLGPDGWLYGRCGHSCPGKLGVPGTPEEKRVAMKGGIWRYHPERKIVEVLTHGTTNPWGHDWDANGEMFFINTVTGHLWHLMHGAHLMDSAVNNPLVYERLDTIADHYHYDRTGSWMESRDGKANSLGGGHAHIGMMIYQADQWPAEYRNKLFTLNMHGRRANVERLERNGSGYVGRHEPDVFLVEDPWFRGIEIGTGPDGSGFILDWSDTGECHESTGVHRTSGRIYRISYGIPAKPEKPFAWKKPLPTAALNSGNEHGRVLAIRELTQFWPLDTIAGPMKGAVYPAEETAYATLVKMAKEDSSSLVRLTLASTLQRLPVAKRTTLALALVAHAGDAADPFLPYLVWYGISPLANEDPKALLEIAKGCSWPKTLTWIARSLTSQPAMLNELLTGATKTQLEPMLQGLADAFKGMRKAPKPPSWEAVTAKLPPSDLVRDLSILFGDGRALDDVKKLALDAEAELPAREAALKTLIDARPKDLRAVCESLLEARGLATTAVRGLGSFGDPVIGERLAKNYRKFAAGDRAAVLDVLVARPVFVKPLLAEIAAGRIPRADLTAFHARQIRSFNDEALSQLLKDAWGELRESAGDKKALMADLKQKLTPEVLGKATLANGRILFTALCSACHMMYGIGGKVGPDLTGSGRANLDYLLENIVDPSGVVSADFRMSLLTLKDGRVLSGVVSQSNERTLTLRTLTEELKLERGEVVKQEVSPVSMMPEGLVLALQPDQVRDLIAYLMHPSQVPLPK